MDLEKKLYEMRSEISDAIKTIRTDEDKKQFAEKYGFDESEVDEVIRKHKEWRRSYKG